MDKASSIFIIDQRICSVANQESLLLIVEYLDTIFLSNLLTIVKHLIDITVQINLNYIFIS